MGWVVQSWVKDNPGLVQNLRGGGHFFDFEGGVTFFPYYDLGGGLWKISTKITSSIRGGQPFFEFASF